jgi:LmbE family N-acetylglucosaminyl deacetylase
MKYVSGFARLLKSLFFRKAAYLFFIKDWRSLGDLQRCADAAATFRHSVNLEPLVSRGPEVRRILVIAPHPDDEMLGPGGTLIAALALGARARVLYLTKGKPAHHGDLVRETLAVAASIGYETRFMDHCARHLPLDAETVNRLRAEIEDFVPQVLMLPFLCDDHDDHRRASHLLWLTAQGLVPMPDIEIWAYQVYSALIPNVVVDITAVAERKRKAIAGWSSQAASRDWGHFALGLNAFNSRFLPRATSPRYAEAFFVVPLRDYLELCAGYFAGGSCVPYYSDAYVES